MQNLTTELFAAAAASPGGPQLGTISSLSVPQTGDRALILRVGNRLFLTAVPVSMSDADAPAHAAQILADIAAIHAGTTPVLYVVELSVT